MERFAPQSYMRGFIFAALGDFDQAIPCLQHVPAVQGQTLLYSRALDPWRHDPRFQQIIAQTGRVAEYERARKEVATLVGMGAAKK